MNPEKLAKIKAEIEKYKEIILNYTIAFEESDGIDKQEQKLLDKLNETINALEIRISKIESGELKISEVRDDRNKARDEARDIKKKDQEFYTDIKGKYIRGGNVDNGGELFILDRNAILTPSKKNKKDPFKTTGEILARVKHINKIPDLANRGITVVYSNNQVRFVPTGPNAARYSVNGATISDTYTILDNDLANGLSIPARASKTGTEETISADLLQELIFKLQVKRDKYVKMRAALLTKRELVQANVDSLLIEQADLDEFTELYELYLGEKGDRDSGCIIDLIRRLHEHRNHHYRAHQDEGVYRALTFIGNPYDQMAADWADDGFFSQMMKRVGEALPKSEERKESLKENEEPEIRDKHEESLNTDKYNEGQVDLSYSGGKDVDGSDISMNDVDQGQVGDCYYLSSVGAIAKDYPEMFELNGNKSIVKEDGDNYIVTLYLRQDKESMDRTPKEVKVSKKAFFKENGDPLYAGKGDDELWVMILERAFAQEMGSFDNIDGGLASNALEILTGKEAHKRSIESISGSNSDKETYILEQLKVAEEKKYPVVIDTKGTGEEEIKVIDANGNEVTLFSGHAYTFDRLEGKTIHLYNPHGENHLHLTMDVFLEQFENFSVLALEKE